MSHDFKTALPDATVFRSITGYLYAYDKDDSIDDSKETAWFSGADQDDSESGGVGLHIADAVKQSKSKRDQLRSQLNLLMTALPSKTDGPKQLFNQYGFTDSDLPEGALYIAQFRMDALFEQDGFAGVRNTVSINENLPDNVLAATRGHLAVLARYATNMFDVLDAAESEDESSDGSDAGQSSTLAVLASFDSIDELNEAGADGVSTMTAFRVTPDDDGSLHFDTQWGDIPDENSWIVSMGFDFYSRLANDLPDAPVADDRSYPAYACFFGDRIPDNATPIAWFFADHTVKPGMLRCFVRLPEDQESLDTLVLLRCVLDSYTSAARRAMANDR